MREPLSTTRPTIIRRGAVVASAVTLVMFLAGCAGSAGPAPTESEGGCDPNDVVVVDGVGTAPEECQFPGETLRVAAYSGFMTEALQAGVGTLLEEATGAKIEWVGTDNATVISQLFASRGGEPPLDVVSGMTTDGVFNLLQGEPLLEKLPPLENLADFPSQAVAVDGYGPGFYYYLTGMCVRRDMFEAAGLPTDEGFDVFTDPALAGKVGFPAAGISQWELTIPAVAAYLGADLDDPAPVVEWASGIEGLKLWPSSSDFDQMMQTGEIWISPQTEARCLELKNQGLDLDYVSINLTVDGDTYDAIAATTGAYIVAGTPVPELAAIYVNLVNTPEGLLPYLEGRFYPPTNPRTVEAVLETMPDVDPEVDADTLFQADYAALLENRREWLDQWSRAFQG